MVERTVIADESECWDVVASRDAVADGRFVYAVVTTGIYCRPSCPTPTPLRRNVRFFPDSAAAEASGFHACKRCRPTLASPLAWHAAAVDKACAILSASERAPSLAAVADAVGVSRFHFHRVFKEVLDTTPGEYFKAVRWRRLAQSLASGRTVTEAIYGAGYGSISRAYENAREVLGMTPAARRAGGAGIRVGFTFVGQGNRHVLVAATDVGVCAIEFGDDPSELEARLRRHLPTAVMERLDADAAARVATAVRRAELPPLALGLPADVREVAIRARLRSALGQGSRRRPQSRVGRPSIERPVGLPVSSGSAPAFADVGDAPRPAPAASLPPIPGIQLQQPARRVP